MSHYLRPLMFVVIGLIPAVGFGYLYANGQVGMSTLAFLEVSVLTLGVVVFIFAGKMGHPERVDGADDLQGRSSDAQLTRRGSACSGRLLTSLACAFRRGVVPAAV